MPWFDSSIFFLCIHIIPLIDRNHLNKLTFNFYLSHFTTRTQSTGQRRQTHRKQNDEVQKCIGLCRVTHKAYFTVCRNYRPQTICMLFVRKIHFCILPKVICFLQFCSYLPEVSAICRRKAKVSSMTITTNRVAAITFSQCETEF